VVLRRLVARLRPAASAGTPASTPEPQAGILPEPSSSALFLVLHDLGRWAALPAREQEGIVGRRKPDSKELSEAAKPPTAHIARTVIEEHGEELEIVRHSFPYGTTSEHGLFFIAYCRTLDIPERMLARMVGASGDGLHDRLLEFSRAVSGAHFFASSLAGLRRLGSV
jgi:putative iron-dependent peroxidase